MNFFNGKNTQQLKQPGGNGGREKNTKKRITVYLFVIFHGISVQSNRISKGIGEKIDDKYLYCRNPFILFKTKFTAMRRLYSRKPNVRYDEGEWEIEHGKTRESLSDERNRNRYAKLKPLHWLSTLPCPWLQDETPATTVSNLMRHCLVLFDSNNHKSSAPDCANNPNVFWNPCGCFTKIPWLIKL